jgi:hypothetical protein
MKTRFALAMILLTLSPSLLSVASARGRHGSTQPKEGLMSTESESKPRNCLRGILLTIGTFKS